MNDIKGIIEDVEKSSLVSDKVIKKIIEIIGQEEWQDLHDENNDICTTMGELIITLKGIAELEKENYRIKEELEKMTSVADYQQSSNMKRYSMLTQTEEKLKKARNIIKHLLIMLHEKELYGVYVSIAQDFMAEVEEEDADKTEESQDL